VTRSCAAHCGALLAAVAGMGHADAALAGWSAAATGGGAAKARVMPAGNQPSATVSNRSVTVSWSQSSFAGGPAVSGYVVKRYSTGGVVQTIGAGCSGIVGGLSCTETNVPPGSWRYSVTPTQGAWSGTESPLSAAVTVAAAALSLSSTTVTALPSTLTGSISGFAPGQTVTFRLDNPTTGTVLTGSITPSPVPASGSASVSVTIPAGTTNGAHTVYAVGSAGDTASTAVTVAVPTFVKNVGTAMCGGTSLSVTVPAAGVAVNHTLILRLALRGTTAAAVTASDTRGNTYSVDRSVLNGNQRVVILRARVTTALTSGNAITVTFPSSTASALVADEFSGIAPTPVDVSGSGTGSGTSPSASVTTTNARDFLIGAVSVGAQSSATQPSGWTALTARSTTCSSAIAGIGARRLVASTGTYTYNPTLGTSGTWAAAIVAYKAG
jgi:hypothetical protein